MSPLLRGLDENKLPDMMDIHFSRKQTYEKNVVIFSAAGATFDIPFNRQQLADYLNTDRSALSNELGKMRDDGLIEFYKNTFRLKAVSQALS